MSEYFVVPYKRVTDEMIKCCKQTSRETLRHTISGDDMVILSIPNWDRLTDDLRVLDRAYSHQQIKKLIRAPEWTPPELLKEELYDLRTIKTRR